MKTIKNPDLFQKIRSFLVDYLPTIRSKSVNTVSAYKVTINLYLLFLQTSQKKGLSDVEKKDFNQKNIIAFLEWLKEERGNGIATRNQRLVHIRQFCKQLMSSDMMAYAEYCLIQQIAKEADPKKDELDYLSVEEMKLVLEQPDIKKKSGIRDKFYLALLYDSGCRNQEILDLKLKDFVITGACAELHIVGKGRKYRVTPISKDVIKLFQRYCDIYHPGRKMDDWIFLTRRNGIVTQMSPDNTARFLNKYERQITKKNPDFLHLHPHLFRHTREMHLYMAGMPLPLISEWLGHSQLETTTIYARATTDMKRKAAEKITTKENSVFKEENFKYANNDDIIKRLYGLA
jgi:site-specific recombinase XerD